MHSKQLHVCTVCGLYCPNFCPWREAGKDLSREICDFSGVGFGYENGTADFCRSYRNAGLRTARNGLVSSADRKAGV